MGDAHPEFALAWRRLRAGTVQGGDLTIPSVIIPGVSTSSGPLRAAIGTSGEITLLVPIGFRERFPEVKESPSLAVQDSKLTVGKDRVRFVEIVCRTPELDEVFAQVADKIVQRISDGVSTGSAVERTLDEFRQLFMRGRTTEVTVEKAAGLVAELLLLRQILSSSSAAWRFWTGPEGSRHDFTHGDLAIEVKASLRAQRSIIEISALDQLLVPRDGRLVLAHVSLETTPDGPLHVPDLAKAALALADDADGLAAKLMAAGFVREQADDWTMFKFTEIRRSMFSVNEGFPRITPASFEPHGVPAGVSHVRYRINLAHAEPFRMNERAIEQLLRDFTR